MTAEDKIIVVSAGALLIWIVLAGLVASYGRDKGLAFAPLFICSLLLGWPLVLLAVTITPDRRSSF